jgi:hypothetical protein
MGNYLGSNRGKLACVPQTEFDQAKTQIEEAFTGNVKKVIKTLQQVGLGDESRNGSPDPGVGGSPHFGSQPKVEKAVKWLGEIEEQSNLLHKKQGSCLASCRKGDIL